MKLFFQDYYNFELLKVLFVKEPIKFAPTPGNQTHYLHYPVCF
jgi:hypothetical protein